ncbi:hypothetical protein [Levilactobacillus brevis]|uniref:hypothetical protein n=1 Tax=Levilactobacillus brevis TaxID=1580 RepID=UPI000A206AF0|nr:hypothetical protein [Levilactobacillus brevis]ARN97454.1 hypothetical protein AZI10_04800 [Levilactobacillus brevis]
MDEADKSTIQNVRLIRSDLTKVSDDTIQLAIDDAWTEVQNRGFPHSIKSKHALSSSESDQS